MDTAPIRPQPEPRCVALDCPIVHIHSQGIYLWQGEPPSPGLIKDIFGPSNPPPRVSAAYELAENPVPGIEPHEQAKLWEGFHRHHTRPVQPNQLAEFTSRTQCKSGTCPLQATHREGAYFHGRRQHYVYTSTFGYANPPPIIWEAHERQERGEGTEEERQRDRDVVEAFASHHGLFHGAKSPSKEGSSKKRKRWSGGSIEKSSANKFVLR